MEVRRRIRRDVLELADEPDLWLQMHAAFGFDRLLRDGDQLSDVLRGRAAEVDHDVGVDMRDLSAAASEAFESALVDQTTGTDAFHLFEDGSGARMPIEPWMLSAAPAQVFLEDSLKHVRLTSGELECDGQHHIAPMMK